MGSTTVLTRLTTPLSAYSSVGEYTYSTVGSARVALPGNSLPFRRPALAPRGSSGGRVNGAGGTEERHGECAARAGRAGGGGVGRLVGRRRPVDRRRGGRRAGRRAGLQHGADHPDPAAPEGCRAPTVGRPGPRLHSGFGRGRA